MIATGERLAKSEALKPPAPSSILPSMSDKRPNILFIMTDEQRFDCVGYANPAVKTPNLDALAAGSVLFRRAYTPNPSCVPARAAISTGRYPSQCGAPTFITYLARPEVTFMDLLRRTGYHTAVIGKQHFGRTDIELGYDYAEINDMHTPGWQVAEAGDESPSYPRFLKAQGQTDPDKLWRREGRFAARWLGDEKHHIDHFMGERGKWWLAEKRPADKPWFFCLSFPGPHMPYDGLGLPDEKLYGPAQIDLPATCEADLAGKPPHFAAQIETGHGNPGKMPVNDITDEEIRTTRLSYYANQTLIDRKIGEVLDALRATGEYDNTMIIYTTDHGDFMGDFGLVGKGQYLSEVLMRVPLLIKPPVADFAGREENALVNLVDLATTCLAVAGAEIPENLSGDDLSAFWTDPAGATRREDAYTEAAGLRAVRTDRWKLVHYLNRPYGELYDLQDDPWERTNLWDSPDAEAVAAKADLTRRLADRMITLGARSTIPWNTDAPEI